MTKSIMVMGHPGSGIVQNAHDSYYDVIARLEADMIGDDPAWDVHAWTYGSAAPDFTNIDAVVVMESLPTSYDTPADLRFKTFGIVVIGTNRWVPWNFVYDPVSLQTYPNRNWGIATNPSINRGLANGNRQILHHTATVTGAAQGIYSIYGIPTGGYYVSNTGTSGVITFLQSQVGSGLNKTFTGFAYDANAPMANQLGVFSTPGRRITLGIGDADVTNTDPSGVDNAHGFTEDGWTIFLGMCDWAAGIPVAKVGTFESSALTLGAYDLAPAEVSVEGWGVPTKLS